MSSSAEKPQSSAASQCGSQTRKLRFDDVVTTGSADLGESSYLGNASTHSALKSSPTASVPPESLSSPPQPSSVAHSSDLHVHVDLNPQIIEHDAFAESPDEQSPLHSDVCRHVEAGEVAHLLADLTASGDFAASTHHVSAISGDSSIFRPLFLQIAGSVLEHRPKDPEQYIIDYLLARKLSNSSLGRSLTMASREVEDDVNVEPDDEDSSAAATVRGGVGGLSSTSASHDFQPVGETVVERLASNARRPGAGRTVLARLAKLVVEAKPSDPENFLWTRLEGRSFAEESSHFAYTGEGFQLLLPEDPIQLAIIREIPADSPGYVVAAELVPLLFAKKPDDPLSYLFYHVGSRTHSGGALSIRSGSLQNRGAEEEISDIDSCTSREFADESDSAIESEEDSADVSAPLLQRKGSLGSLFDAAASQTSRRNGDKVRPGRCEHSNSRSSDCGRRLLPHRSITVVPTPLHNAKLSRSQMSPAQDSVPPPSTHRGGKTARTSTVPTADLSSFHTASSLAGAGKRVSISEERKSHRLHQSQLPATSGTGWSPLHSYVKAVPGLAANSSSSYENVTSQKTLDALQIASEAIEKANEKANTTASLSSLATQMTFGRSEGMEYQRICDEYRLLRLKEEQRLDRLVHEIRSMARECEYCERLASIKVGDVALQKAADVSRQVLQEALRYQQFLLSQIERIDGDMQHQLYTLTQCLSSNRNFTSGCWASADPVRRDCPHADVCVPSEAAILRKRLELASMEEARIRHVGSLSAE